MTRRHLFQGVGEGTTLFFGFLHFTLDPYLILLSVKEGGIKYHFLSLFYWDWTLVSRAINEHSTHLFNGLVKHYTQSISLHMWKFKKKLIVKGLKIELICKRQTVQRLKNKEIIDSLINFNGMSTCLGLFYAQRLENCVLCTFICTFFCIVA